MTDTTELPPLPAMTIVDIARQTFIEFEGRDMQFEGIMPWVHAACERVARAYAAEAVRVALNKAGQRRQPVAWADPASVARLQDTARSPLAHTMIDLCLSKCGRQTMALYADREGKT